MSSGEAQALCTLATGLGVMQARLEASCATCPCAIYPRSRFGCRYSIGRRIHRAVTNCTLCLHHPALQAPIPAKS